VSGLTANWSKSTKSNGSDSCVEARIHAGNVQIRDSKDPSGPVLTFDASAYLAFLTTVKTNSLHPR